MLVASRRLVVLGGHFLVERDRILATKNEVRDGEWLAVLSSTDQWAVLRLLCGCIGYVHEPAHLSRNPHVKIDLCKLHTSAISPVFLPQSLQGLDAGGSS
jgi:hypothetical protein